MERAFPWRLVTVDIDGTLARTHGWRELAVAFGRLLEYDDTNRRFFAHEIGEDPHLADLLDIVTGQRVSEVEAIVARTSKLRGIREGISRMRELGCRTALLTHNPTYVVDWYRRTFGFDDAEGVNAQTVEDGRIGSPTGVRADKPAGLAALLERSSVPSARAAHVGDGWSDAQVFRLVGGGVALNSTLAEVNRAADLVLATEDFGEVVDGLSRLTPRV
ncbi:MAG TPA: HAD family hydrolase [Thermoplasmata archaeon]|nr:HAD family hydrolase [Thermoplasmata archaeon]